MPMYDFKCSCGMTFEKIVDTGEEEYPCPSCDEKAERVLSNFGGYEFEGTPSDPSEPGVKSIDHWIGKDAEGRNERVKDRNRRKSKLKWKYGEDAPIRRRPDGHYEVMSDEEEREVRQFHADVEKMKKEGEWEPVNSSNDMESSDS